MSDLYTNAMLLIGVISFSIICFLLVGTFIDRYADGEGLMTIVIGALLSIGTGTVIVSFVLGLV